MRQQLRRNTEPRGGPEGKLRIEVLRGPEGLETIAGEWRRLVLGIPNSRFFQYPEWHRSHLSALEFEPARISYFVAYRDELIVAVFPLRHRLRRVHGLTLRTLGLISHSHITLGDFTFAQQPENAALMRTFVGWLRAQREFPWDVLHLDGVPERSAITFALETDPPSLLLRAPSGISSYIPCEEPYSSATGAISGSFKRNLSRLARRAEQTGTLTYCSVQKHVELVDALARFLEIEASGWKGRDGTAIKCDHSLVMFYRWLVEEFGPKDQCCVNILCHGDRDIAAQFCLRAGESLNILKIGFDEADSAIAPGNLLMERTLQACCEDTQIRQISFVTSPAWDHVWKPLSETVWEYQAFNTSPYGRALYALVRGKRLIDKRVKIAETLIRAAKVPRSGQ